MQSIQAYAGQAGHIFAGNVFISDTFLEVRYSFEVVVRNNMSTSLIL